MIPNGSTHIDLVELETFYGKNQGYIDHNMVVLVIQYFHLFVVEKVEKSVPVLQDLNKYDLYGYCIQVADLIALKTFQNFPKDRKDLLQSILVTFVIQPIFLKFFSLSEGEKQQCLLYRGMLEPGQPITYASLIFYDHYKYYYFPDATIALLEFIYLCKKRVRKDFLQDVFRSDTYPSLQRYLSKTIDPNVPRTLLHIYEKFSGDYSETSKEVQVVLKKMQAYLAYLRVHTNDTVKANSQMNPLWLMLEGTNPLISVFPHAAIIYTKEMEARNAEKEAKEKADEAMRVLLADEPKASKSGKKPIVKPSKGKEKELKESLPTLVESTIVSAFAPTPTLTPTPALTPVPERSSCSIRDGAPITPYTNAVFEKAMKFCVEQSQVGMTIDPSSLPIVRKARAFGDLPTKHLVYGVSLLILLNETLYNTESRRMISRLLQGPMLEQDDMRKREIGRAHV